MATFIDGQNEEKDITIMMTDRRMARYFPRHSNAESESFVEIAADMGKTSLGTLISFACGG